MEEEHKREVSGSHVYLSVKVEKQTGFFFALPVFPFVHEVKKIV